LKKGESTTKLIKATELSIEILKRGGNFAKPLFEANLINEIIFNIHPVLLGSGIPIFYQVERQINFKLIECRPFKNGCVYVLHQIKH